MATPQTLQFQQNAAAILNQRKRQTRGSQPRTPDRRRGGRLSRPIAEGNRSTKSAAVEQRPAFGENIDQVAQINRDRIHQNKTLAERNYKIKLLQTQLGKHATLPANFSLPQKASELVGRARESGDENMEREAEAFQAEATALALRDRALESTDPERIRIQQNYQRAFADLKKKQEKLEKALKTFKSGKDTMWNLYAKGGAIEVEGAGLWSWFGTGVLIDMIRFLLIVFTQKAKAKLSPGELLKVFVPTRPTNPADMFGVFFYGLFGFMMLLFMFLFLNAVVLILLTLLNISSDPLGNAFNFLSSTDFINPIISTVTE